MAKRVAIIHRSAPPLTPIYPATDWVSKHTPPYLRPTQTPLLQLAQERYCYLRSAHGGSFTLEQLIADGQTRISREQRGAHTLDWQLGQLTTLWPADPLCAPPH